MRTSTGQDFGATKSPLRTVVSALAVLALTASAASAASGPTATKWIDKPDGYSIILPPKWYVIPRTTAEIQKLIAQLKAQKQTSLAGAYKAILESSESKAELKDYRFQAFLWPPLASLVPTELSLQVVSGTRTYTAKDLPAIAATYANAFSGNKGAKITVPKKVQLGAGPAERIDGTIPSGQATTGLELYLFVHGKRIYALSFKIDAGVLAKATVFHSIADHFAFV
jgi:hypothetical protein